MQQVMNMPQVVWCNSKSLYSAKEINGSIPPCVIHDAMPDGVFDGPDQNTINAILHSLQYEAVAAWIKRNASKAPRVL